MVKGLELFKNHFESFDGQYVLIGGTACDLAMEEVGQTFRGTQDLDIVLCTEALTDAFIEAFWSFVKDGDYESREKSSGDREFYRFLKPKNKDYPAELELFSRKPDVLTLPEDCHLTPIPAAEDVSNLSAILLDDDYYQWIRDGDRLVGGVHMVGAEQLIPLKIKAWLDLTARKERGEHVDSRKIKKHRNDIFRLFTILSRDPLPSVPFAIKQDIATFIQKIVSVEIDFKNLGLGGLEMSEILEDLRNIYQVELH